MQRYRPIIAINIAVLVILCIFVLHFAGRHGGAVQATAGNVAVEDAPAKDVTIKATTDSAVAAPADDVATGMAIGRSPDVTLNFGEETVNATPFIPDFRLEDYSRNLVEVHRGVDTDKVAGATELYDKTTGQLWALSMTTQTVYEVELLYLDAQHRQLILKAINRPGEPASWGMFRLSDAFTGSVEQCKRLEITTGDGVRRIFVLAGSAKFSGE